MSLLGSKRPPASFMLLLMNVLIIHFSTPFYADGKYSSLLLLNNRNRNGALRDDTTKWLGMPLQVESHRYFNSDTARSVNEGVRKKLSLNTTIRFVKTLRASGTSFYLLQLLSFWNSQPPTWNVVRPRLHALEMFQIFFQVRREEDYVSCCLTNFQGSKFWCAGEMVTTTV